MHLGTYPEVVSEYIYTQCSPKRYIHQANRKLPGRRPSRPLICDEARLLRRDPLQSTWRWRCPDVFDATYLWFTFSPNTPTRLNNASIFSHHASCTVLRVLRAPTRSFAAISLPATPETPRESPVNAGKSSLSTTCTRLQSRRPTLLQVNPRSLSSTITIPNRSCAPAGQ